MHNIFSSPSIIFYHCTNFDNLKYISFQIKEAFKAHDVWKSNSDSGTFTSALNKKRIHNPIYHLIVIGLTSCISATSVSSLRIYNQFFNFATDNSTAINNALGCFGERFIYIMIGLILTLLILGGGGFFVVYASDYPSSISSTDFLIEQSTGTKEKNVFIKGENACQSLT